MFQQGIRLAMKIVHGYAGSAIRTGSLNVVVVVVVVTRRQGVGGLIWSGQLQQGFLALGIPICGQCCFK